MAQFARPDSDVATGSWTATPLFQKIDEATRADGDLITSADNSSGDTCEVGLSDVTDPVSSTGHVLRYTYRKNAVDGHAIDIRVRLLQGVTEIASFTHTAISETFTQASQTLSTGQADAITDYTNLRVEFQRNGETGGHPSTRRSAQVSWAELEVPDAAPAGLEVTPSPVVLTFSVTAPTLTPGTATVSPSPVNLAFGIPSPSLTSTLTITPDPVQLSFAVAAPTLEPGTAVVNPSPLVLTLALPVPAAEQSGGSQTVTPAPVVLNLNLPTPSLSGAAQASPSPVVLTLSPAAPALTPGGVTVNPDPVVLTLVLPVPGLDGGEGGDGPVVLLIGRGLIKS